MKQALLNCVREMEEMMEAAPTLGIDCGTIFLDALRVARKELQKSEEVEVQSCLKSQRNCLGLS